MKSKELHPVRKVQKKVIRSADSATAAASSVYGKVGALLKNLDDDLGVSSTISEKGKQVRDSMSDLDDKLGVSEKAAELSERGGDLYEKGKDLTKQAAKKVGIPTAVKAISKTYDSYVADPASELIEKYRLEQRVGAIGRAVANRYGDARSVIKPYFPPDTPEELLQNTRTELAYISACIMQISAGEAEKLAAAFSKVVASKIAGLAAGGALLSIVSMIGTAGTGTAIASLSGAAATSASLAWVGGLVGGGMAAGTVLTGGVGMVIGLSAYKLLGSERRDFEKLDEVEQRIVQSCWMLIAIIDDYLEGDKSRFDAESARALLIDTLLPLQKLLEDNSDDICQNLDTKNALAYRQHVLKDFGPTVIEPFAEFTESGLAERALHYEYVIGGVIYALMTGTAVDDSMESQLVLSALRRSDSNLVDATEAELSSYLSDYDAEQLKGIANNVKGIYHELLWVEQYNAANDDTRAELIESTNHEGSDVRIIEIETNEVVTEYQLKATDSVSYVNEHVIRHPSVQVVATEEVASKMEDVQSSGNLNTDLQEKVESDIEALEGNALGDRTLEVAGLAATIATGQELLEMLHGKREFPEAVTEVVKKTGTAGAATAITAYLFS